MTDEEYYGCTVYRMVPVTVKPTVVEIADIIWHMDADNQVALIGCLKRRFCNDAGLMQMVKVASTLKELPTEKADEVKEFIECLADYILGEKNDR